MAPPGCPDVVQYWLLGQQIVQYAPRFEVAKPGCVDTIIGTEHGVIYKFIYDPANAVKRPIFNGLPLCRYSGKFYL